MGTLFSCLFRKNNRKINKRILSDYRKYDNNYDNYNNYIHNQQNESCNDFLKIHNPIPTPFVKKEYHTISNKNTSNKNISNKNTSNKSTSNKSTPDNFLYISDSSENTTPN